MATSKATRFFTGFMALLFLATASALTIAIVVQGIQNRKKPGDGGTSTPASQTTTNQNKEATLTGTKMQDFTPLTQPVTTLQKIDLKEGTGDTVKAHDTVTADYVGALASTGIIFDASADHGGPIAFPLDGVIKGWGDGIPGMKVGGKRRLIIPASLGYGSTGSGSSIPPNADLVFDVTITKIGK
jgi:FKBP-type peptidyl-prolyl cis-trans isomerase